MTHRSGRICMHILPGVLAAQLLSACGGVFYSGDYRASAPPPAPTETRPEDWPIVIVNTAPCAQLNGDSYDQARLTEECTWRAVASLRASGGLWAFGQDSFESQYFGQELAPDVVATVAVASGEAVPWVGIIVLAVPFIVTIGTVPMPGGGVHEDWTITVGNNTPVSKRYRESRWGGWIPALLSTRPERQREYYDARERQLSAAVLSQLPAERPPRSDRISRYLRHIYGVSKDAAPPGPNQSAIQCAISRLDFLKTEVARNPALEKDQLDYVDRIVGDCSWTLEQMQAIQAAWDVYR